MPLLLVRLPFQILHCRGSALANPDGRRGEFLWRGAVCRLPAVLTLLLGSCGSFSGSGVRERAFLPHNHPAESPMAARKRTGLPHSAAQA